MSSYGKGQNAVGHLRSGDVHGSNLSFEKLYLQDWLAKALAKNNYKWQSKLQEASLPSVLTGKDVVIQVKMVVILAFNQFFSQNLEQERRSFFASRFLKKSTSNQTEFKQLS
jgi:hypothetical protein